MICPVGFAASLAIRMPSVVDLFAASEQSFVTFGPPPSETLWAPQLAVLIPKVGMSSTKGGFGGFVAFEVVLT